MTYAAADIHVRIDGATLLEGVSVSVATGELVAVAGPNGAGKSTLIATLAGDRAPAGGRVTLSGRPLGDWSRGELARRRAVMSAERAIAFAFHAEDVALLGRLPLHGGRPTRSRSRHRAEAAGGGRLRPPREPRLRHALHGRAAARGPRSGHRAGHGRPDGQPRDADADPVGGHARSADSDPVERFLLLDEPTSSLDPAHQHLAMRLLRGEADAGRGVLAVLHDLNLAAAYADRLVLMANARVVASGPPRDVLRPDLLEHVFGIPMLVLPHPAPGPSTRHRRAAHSPAGAAQ